MKGMKGFQPGHTHNFREDLDDDEIVRLYLNDRMTTTQIGALYEVEPTTICRRLKNKGVVLRGKAGTTPVRDRIRGQLPAKSEIAIYYLRSGEVPFYVGSTAHPSKRLSAHIDAFGEDTEMAIVRCCPEDQVVYWESKLLVDMVEAGCVLLNTEIAKTDNQRRNNGER